jgi:hypothetical protein
MGGNEVASFATEKVRDEDRYTAKAIARKQ